MSLSAAMNEYKVEVKDLEKMAGREKMSGVVLQGELMRSTQE